MVHQDPTTRFHFPRNADYQPGDKIFYQGRRTGRFYPIDTVEQFTHPDATVARNFGPGTIRLHCEDDFVITLAGRGDGSVPVSWDHTPETYRARILAELTSSTSPPSGAEPGTTENSL